MGGLVLGLCAAGAPAGEVVWRPVNPAPIASTPGAAAGRPAATLGAPIAVSFPAADDSVRPVSYAPPAVVRSQEPPPPAPPPVSPLPGGVPAAPPPPAELYQHGVVTDPPPAGGSFWDRCKDWITPQSGAFGSATRKPFQSDHCFDEFISPLTNPFLFEDPRSLTELRPVFIYQTIPNKNWAYNGGDVVFFGTQARVAFTDRFSVVLNKLGGIWVNPGDNPFPGYEKASGFAEVDIGPKFTFLRNEQSKTLGALGLTFQIPTGSKEAFQDTGDLSLVPYLSMAQNFGRSSYGSFNAMGTLGYAFATDKLRSDYFFTSLHLDYDVANLHKVYPLIELNWTHFTSNGSARVQNFEGGDLINYGATEVSGNNTLNLAFGVRYKFTECVQFGTAVEFPVVGRKDIEDFRLTVDMIFRY
jgi:hypothetical protein